MTSSDSIPNIHILIVDDDQLVRDFAVHTIEYGINRKVTTMDCGFQAWQYIQQQPENVDIIIADANIPDMDGLELLEKVKKSYPKKTFIITTGSTACMNDAYQLGADALLTKPYDVNDLFTIVQKFIVNTDAPSKSNVTEFPTT